MPVTGRALRLAAALGVGLGDTPEEAERLGWVERVAGEVDAALGAGGVALVTGASGAGKTSVLRALARRVSDRAGGSGGGCAVVVDARALEDEERAAVELFDLPLDETVALLARAGLAEARALLRPVRELSEGQRFRVGLAVGMGEVRNRNSPGAVVPPKAEPRLDNPRATNSHPRLAAGPAHPGTRRITLIVDEFASVLDRTTAACVAWMFGEWARRIGAERGGVRAVVGTAHEDVMAALRPDVVVRVRMGERGSVWVKGGMEDAGTAERTRDGGGPQDPRPKHRSSWA